MAEYDFRSLSPHDFEQLCRDLLQEELGVRLESFTVGRDSGIDFRYRSGTENLIVQCKHYADSGFGALSRVLERKERKKLEELAPTRYILATSVPLTPRRKDGIQRILSPYCLSPEDIFGRDDINGLLAVYEEIERKHFKLWLTSVPVLERVLHAGIFTDSELHLDRVRLRLSRYVPNPSFERAQALLDKNHFCIIAGIPGIGKTTLAEVLLAELVDRQGFTPYRVGHDLSELRPVKNPHSKQVFYFDDFLGKTALEKLQKNEDQRLVELMDEVAGNPDWRFILTTREYILNIAMRRYEAFASPPVNLTLCVINLSDYTRPIRAKILYNHIYFSELPKAYKLALLEDRGYEAILAHRNYNPRVVEYMTQWRHASAVPATLYRREFLDTLEKPTRIWDHPFRYQISEAARHLLLVLATLPDEATLENLEKSFWHFYRFRQKRFGFPTGPGDWADALKELDGSFIKTDRIGKDIVVSFHTPSVKDFLEQFLESSNDDVLDLFEGALFYEQYVSLWSGFRGRPYQGVERAIDEFLRALASNLNAPSARTVRSVSSYGEALAVISDPPSNESRAEFFVRVVHESKSPLAGPLTESLLGQLSERWKEGSADREDLVRLLDVLAERGLKKEEAAFVAARKCLMMSQESIEDWRAAGNFCQKYPDAVYEAELETLRSHFTEFASEYSSGLDDDPDWLRQVAADLEYVGERLDVETDEFTQSLYERADEIERERAEEEPPHDDEDRWFSSGSYVDDVHGMFDGLRSDLKDS